MLRQIGSPNLGLPSPLLRPAKTPDLLREIRSATGGIESYPITQYLVTMATLLRDQLQSNVTDDVIEKDMVDIILFMQKLSQVSVFTYMFLFRFQDFYGFQFCHNSKNFNFQFITLF